MGARQVDDLRSAELEVAARSADGATVLAHGVAVCQARLSLSMAFRVTMSFRMAATRATLGRFPVASRRCLKAFKAGLNLVATWAAMKRTRRTAARPASAGTRRPPCCLPGPELKEDCADEARPAPFAVRVTCTAPGAAVDA